MKIYVASSILNREKVCDVIAELKAHGHEITQDWTKDIPDPKAPDFREQLWDCGKRDFAGVLAADLVFILNHPKGKDMFTEFGIALGSNKSIVFVDSHVNNSSFFRCGSIYHATSVSDGILAVDKLEKFRKGS